MGRKGKPASAKGMYNSAKGRLDSDLAKGKIKTEAEYNRRLERLQRMANVDVEGEELRKRMQRIVDQGE